MKFFLIGRTRRHLRRTGLALPQLSGLPPEKRVEAYETACQRATWRPEFFLYFAGMTAAAAAADQLYLWFYGSRFNPGFPEILSLPITLGVVLAGSRFGGRAFGQRFLQPELWKFMPHTCGGCGYDLTANASGVCPECGRAAGRAEAEKVE